MNTIPPGRTYRVCFLGLWLIIGVYCLSACKPTETPTAESSPQPQNTEDLAPVEVTPAALPSPTQTSTAVPTVTSTPVVVLAPERILISFEAADGELLEGYYYPGSKNPAPVIVLMNWARGNQGEWEEIAYWLQGRGLLEREQNSRKTWKSSNWYPEQTLDMPLGVFTFNFRSCEGEDGCQAYLPVEWLLDAQAALETAAQLEGVNPRQIVTAGASIGADGAVDSCAWLNTTGLGTCLGALALSPSSSLTVDFQGAADALIAQENPARVYCVFGLQDEASMETCLDYPGIRSIDYGYVEYHGLELIQFSRRPDPLNIFQEFILEAIGGAQ